MKTMRMMATALAAVLLAGVAQAATYYVDVNYDGFNGAPDGTETRPYTNLYAASVAYTNGSGHTIRVARGEYKSTVEGGYELFGQAGYEAGYNLQGISGNWHGGYVGQVSGATFDWTEDSRVLPDTDTIAPASVTVINLTNANARAFYSTAYQHTLNFTGFVFRDSDVSQGSYDGGALYVGGGMNAAAVHSCVFINNITTGNGGALWHSGRGGTSTDCVFIDNIAGGSGGAVRMQPGNGSQAIRGFTFLNNTAAVNGGGLWVEGYTVNVDQCHFEGNTANGSGDNGGGAISTASSTITRTVMVNNSAPNGWGGAVGRKVWQGSYMTLDNCLVVSNSAVNFAVASYAGYNGAALTLRHVTMVDNTGGGAITKAGNSSFSATLTVLNSIIANNGAKGLEYTDSGTLNVDYNNVLGHTTDYVGFTAGSNDIAVDPEFVNAAAGNFRLQSTSLCIDAGTDIGITVDLDGVGRPTGYGVDIGAYEERELPAFVYRYAMSQETEATPRFELIYVPDDFPTDAWIVFDTADQGTNAVTDWQHYQQIVTPAEGVPFGYTFTSLDADTEYAYRLWVTNDYGTVWGDLATVRTLPTGSPLQLLWTPTSDLQRWSAAASETNWTANAGMTLTPWVQGASAVFDGLPPVTPNVWGGDMQFNSITLAGVSSGTLTIGRVSGGDQDRLVTVGDAVVDAPAGTAMSLPQVGGSAGMTVTGGGLVSTSRGFVFSGGLRVLDGTFQGLPSTTNGEVELLDESGSAEGRIFVRGVNSSWTMNGNVTVRGGSTGKGRIENSTTTGSGFAPTMAGNIAMTNTLYISGDTRVGSASFTLSGDISGPGELELDFASWGNGGIYYLTGDNSLHTGPLTILNSSRTGVSVQLNGIQGNANITIPVNVAVSGSGTLICNIADGVADQITLGNNATIDLSGLTLEPIDPVRTPAEYPLISPNTGVSGTFANVVGKFQIDYDGTDTYPNDVVLIVPPPPGSLFLLR